MERLSRTFNIIALFSLAVLVVITILCLSFDQAYGYSATVGIGAPTNASSMGAGNSNNEPRDLGYAGGSHGGYQDDVGADSGGLPPPTETPEPGSIILLGAGLVGLAKIIRRRS